MESWEENGKKSKRDTRSEDEPDERDERDEPWMRAKFEPIQLQTAIDPHGIPNLLDDDFLRLSFVGLVLVLASSFSAARGCKRRFANSNLDTGKLATEMGSKCLLLGAGTGPSDRTENRAHWVTVGK